MVQTDIVNRNELICRRYKSGSTIKEIAEEFDLAPSSIKKVLRLLGLGRSNFGLVRRLGLEDRILKLYLEGYSTIKIAAEVGVSRDSVTKTVSRSNIPVRDRSDYRKYHFDTLAFSKQSSESAYWVGFLKADGSISHNTVSLELSKKDYDHIQKLKQYLKAENPILMTKRGARIRLYSERIVSDLYKWGIEENKTFRVQPHYDLIRDVNYWRGLVDGDGCVCKAGVFLCGTKAIIEGFRNYANSHHKIKKHGSIWCITICGPVGRSLLEKLYANAPEHIRLERKYQRAMEHLGR